MKQRLKTMGKKAFHRIQPFFSNTALNDFLFTELAMLLGQQRLLHPWKARRLADLTFRINLAQRTLPRRMVADKFRSNSGLPARRRSPPGPTVSGLTREALQARDFRSQVPEELARRRLCR